jgi:cellulose 1,4-beta-cellobiosidase
MYRAAALVFSLATVAYAQQAGTLVTEVHPNLPIQTCATVNGVNSCQPLNTTIVIDANWRWTHHATGNTDLNCYGTPESPTGWDTTLCPTNGDAAACALDCAVDGIDYNDVGITVDDNGSVTMNFVTTYQIEGQTSTNIGSRVFLMDQYDTNYMGFKLLNQEFTFTVNASNLPCGVNGAAYFVQMDLDGGLSKSPTYNGYKTNTAGPRFGTGYCDAQCPQGIKFISGLVCYPMYPFQ